MFAIEGKRLFKVASICLIVCRHVAAQCRPVPHDAARCRGARMGRVNTCEGPISEVNLCGHDCLGGFGVASKYTDCSDGRNCGPIANYRPP